MSKQANPTLIGAFVLGAILLAAVTVLRLAGGPWFEEPRQHVLYFDGAVQGLQVGSPVVFLGVKVGTVKRIQLGLDAKGGRFLVPVTIELEPNMVQSRQGEQVDLQDRATIRKLVTRGLRGQLRIQSLLTGQLYVDLDFHPDKPARFMAGDSQVSEIPTVPTTAQELAAKLEEFPIDTFLADLAAISQSLNHLLSAEATARIPARLDATLVRLQALATKLDREGGPVLAEMRTDLVELRQTLESARTAMAQVGALTETGPPLAASLTKASDQLAQTAQALKNLADDDSPTVQHLNTALQEIGRTARALRLLAETLEQQPEAILKGKRATEEQP